MVTPMTFGMASRRSALLAGATGLVGGHYLERLLQDDAWEQVAVLGRRAIGNPKASNIRNVARGLGAL